MKKTSRVKDTKMSFSNNGGVIIMKMFQQNIINLSAPVRTSLSVLYVLNVCGFLTYILGVVLR